MLFIVAAVAGGYAVTELTDENGDFKPGGSVLAGIGLIAIGGVLVMGLVNNGCLS